MPDGRVCGLTSLLSDGDKNQKLNNLYRQLFYKNRGELSIPECLRRMNSHEVLPRIHPIFSTRTQKNLDEQYRVLIGELFRNSSLLRAFIMMQKNPSNVSGKVAHQLQLLDKDPKLKIEEVMFSQGDFESFEFFLANLQEQFFSHLPFLKNTSYYELFDLRDEFMSQKILEGICTSKKSNIPDIHVSIGALHLDGIGERLNKVSKQLGLSLQIVEKNSMVPADLEKPFDPITAQDFPIQLFHKDIGEVEQKSNDRILQILSRSNESGKK